MMYKEVTKCRCCESNSLYKYIDLGMQPPANSYHVEGESPPLFPLATVVCTKCWHSQLSVVVDPDILFKNYLYVSGTTQTLKDYFEWFVQLVERFHSKGRVLDIACNDGTQLEMFRKAGWETIGVDPAENLYPITQEKGLNVICDYWTSEVADKVGPVDVIVAQNVFAHVDDVKGFLANCKKILKPNGFIFIQTSQANMIQNGEFDTMYHEHLSFFTTNSMMELLRISNLSLFDVRLNPIHGGSYIFVVVPDYVESSSVKAQLIKEYSLGLNKFETYERFGEKADSTVRALKEVVRQYKNAKLKVVGYGAAAKGMTVLNYGNITRIDAIVDDNPLKQGLLTPGTNIPIVNSRYIEELYPGEPAVFIPLAWNFAAEIRDRIKKIRNNPADIFVKYLPELVITS